MSLVRIKEMLPLVLLMAAGTAVAFMPLTPSFIPARTASLVAGERKLHVQRMASAANDNNFSNDTIVTKEMFLRELLRHPSDDEDTTNPSVTVKRKKGKRSAYKVMDNRDSLPFAVTVATPDPYTHPELKKKAAREQSIVPKKRHDAVEASISSSVFLGQVSDSSGDRKKKGKSDGSTSEMDTSTWLGDFVLDKYTTTGDVLEVGDRQYKVIRHKCQYKYAGGQRFVMTRKILQVKEIGRIQTEEFLKAQLKASENLSGPIPPEEQ